VEKSLPARAGFGHPKVRWESAGEGDSLSRTGEGRARHALVLASQAAESEFADGWRLRNVVKKYSATFPCPSDCPSSQLGDGQGRSSGTEWETVNRASALMEPARTEVRTRISGVLPSTSPNGFREPTELEGPRQGRGKLEYTSLLYRTQAGAF